MNLGVRVIAVEWRRLTVAQAGAVMATHYAAILSVAAQLSQANEAK
jgi:hypothetical protein